MATWYVYILRCADGTLYTGITNDVAHRLDSHNRGQGAKYTRSRRPVELACTFEAADRGAASRLERQLKKLPRARKLALIAASARA